MPLKYTGQWEGVAWAVWKIEEEEGELWRKAELSPAEEAYLATIAHPRRRVESLAARAARKGLPSAGYASLAHSYPWAAAATAPFAVGIDLERHRPFPKAVAPYFMQEAEKQHLESQGLTHWHFWCAKELAYKLLCTEFDAVSFRRELLFDGESVVFRRREVVRRIRVGFVEGEGWLLGLGFFA